MKVDPLIATTHGSAETRCHPNKALGPKISATLHQNMKTSTLNLQIYKPHQAHHKVPTTIFHPLQRIAAFKPHNNHRSTPLKTTAITNKPVIQVTHKRELTHVPPSDFSRFVVVGAVSMGLALLLMEADVQKALALGPEGPLMEEFWDNVRRYALYALTVSTGAVYTIMQPILELLKNPISAVLILVILGGGIFIVSQVLSAMVGVTGFTYSYGY
ncbi:Tapetum determinant 1, putative isoform 1 [Hibiscus syriacus]|uniref:Uncharacterized protein ycf33 n=1 Tax=Hibiscus syriacus TaxID=106335 RepID=A0A6A3B1H1_HIBSY|nr:uncharacterized protein LOC120119632 [Hibiscus syriacus]KAE8708939.1 Tapetum determinant 1, putative isoform 1 [Hibiscus syriacus]